MSSRALSILVSVLLVLPAASSQAWGPATQQAVVTTAVHVFSREGIAQLSRLDRDIRDGAAVSTDMIANLYPGYATGPVRAVETEMCLLDTVRGDVVDPYFAYRLGVLGRLVAALTAPLLDADRNIRDHYYADVDKNMQQLPLKTSQRTQARSSAERASSQEKKRRSFRRQRYAPRCNSRMSSETSPTG